jgi:post-segregation antitoxin (ccd killing protein)
MADPSKHVTTATIRLDDELLKAAKRYRINVSEAARAGIQDAIRRRRMLDNIDAMAKSAVQPKEPSAVTLRRLRDG